MKSKLKLPIEVGRKYFTEDGREIRIYATDGAGVLPIHGAILKECGWVASKWYIDGYNPDYENWAIVYEEWVPEDKELVWCWDNNAPFCRELRFYDSKNNCTFQAVTGKREGDSYDNYAPYEGEWPQWAKEAYEMLED